MITRLQAPVELVTQMLYGNFDIISTISRAFLREIPRAIIYLVELTLPMLIGC